MIHEDNPRTAASDLSLAMASPSTASSRRNSTAASSAGGGGGSRRGSVDSDGGFPFRLKKSKPVSQVKIVFMGKPMVRPPQ